MPNVIKLMEKLYDSTQFVLINEKSQSRKIA